MPVPRITIEELNAKIRRGEDIGIIDVRADDAWAESDIKIKGAIRLTLDKIEGGAGPPRQYLEIITYCT